MAARVGRYARCARRRTSFSPPTSGSSARTPSTTTSTPPRSGSPANDAVEQSACADKTGCTDVVEAHLPDSLEQDPQGRGEVEGHRGHAVHAKQYPYLARCARLTIVRRGTSCRARGRQERSSGGSCRAMATISKDRYGSRRERVLRPRAREESRSLRRARPRARRACVRQCDAGSVRVLPSHRAFAHSGRLDALAGKGRQPCRIELVRFKMKLLAFIEGTGFLPVSLGPAPAETPPRSYRVDQLGPDQEQPDQDCPRVLGRKV
jgi:hypothetical protein